MHDEVNNYTCLFYANDLFLTITHINKKLSSKKFLYKYNKKYNNSLPQLVLFTSVYTYFTESKQFVLISCIYVRIVYNLNLVYTHFHKICLLLYAIGILMLSKRQSYSLSCSSSL